MGNIILVALLFFILKIVLFIVVVKRVKTKKLIKRERKARLDRMINKMNERIRVRAESFNDWDKQEIQVNYNR